MTLIINIILSVLLFKPYRAFHIENPLRIIPTPEHPLQVRKQFQTNPVARIMRSISDQDLTNDDRKPQLTAHHETNFTMLNCTVANPISEVFINCPALGSTVATGPCYHGCQPTKVCSSSGDRMERCIPNEKTVFCQKTHSSNGSVIILLRIVRSDSRLAGSWSCSHAGFDSAKFMIGQQIPMVTQATSPHTNKKISSDYEVDNDRKENIHQTPVAFMSDRPLSYLRKPEVIFAVVTILAFSMLLNIIFCIRCVMTKVYFDARQEGRKSANCLARCLCIPKEKRKAAYVRTGPFLPRSPNWNSLNNRSNSFHGSTQMYYPSANIAQIPLLLNQQTTNEMNNISYCPGGSLSGTLKRHGQAGFPVGAANVSAAQIDMMMNYQPACEQTSNYTQQSCLQDTREPLFMSGMLPSYVRVPSINVPSPNPSHHLLSTSNPTASIPSQNSVSTGIPQYMMRMHPTIMGRHVVYDDVAANNCSIIGSYNHSTNDGIAEAQTALYQSNPPKFNQYLSAFMESNLTQENPADKDVTASESNNQTTGTSNRNTHKENTVANGLRTFLNTKNETNGALQDRVNKTNPCMSVKQIVSQLDRNDGRMIESEMVNGSKE